MNSNRRLLGTGWFVAVLIAGSALPVRAQDSVVGDSGISTFGTIVDMTNEQVTLQVTSGNQVSRRVFPVNEIQKVTFAGEPADLRRARDFIARDQYEDARSALAKISTQGISREEILQDIAFYRAYSEGRLALTGGGDKGAAVRSLRDFQEDPDNQDNFHYYAAVELLGELAVALGSNEAATRYYSIIEKTPWPEYQMRATVALARAAAAAGQYEEALRKYEAVLASTRDDAKARQQKQMAQIGKAVCLASTGKPDEGVAIVRKIIAENDSRANPTLFARAYNALGTCYLRADQPKDALLAFLHVDLLFGQDSEAHAEALYHLADLWRTVNRSDRALQARSLLQSRYGGSPWANRE